MLSLTIQFIYGSITFGFLGFIFISYKTLIAFHLFETSFPESAEEDEYDYEDLANVEKDEEGFYENIRYSREFAASLVHTEFAFFSLLYFFSIIWLFNFFGLFITTIIYFFFILIFYLHSSLNGGFTGRAMRFITRFDYFDPRPGPAVEFNNPLPVFDYLDSDSLLKSSNSPILSSRIGLFSPLESLLYNRFYLDPAFLSFRSDPSFFTKINYYYTQFFILSSVHSYWRSLKTVSSNIFEVGSYSLKFYNSKPEYLSLISDYAGSSNYFSLAGPNFSTFEMLVSRISTQDYSSYYSCLNLPAPYERLLIRIDDKTSVFPYYRSKPALFRLFFSVFSTIFDDFLKFELKRKSSILAKGIKFSEPSILNTAYFNYFPSSYLYRWAAVFFSFKFDYAPFRFKDMLLIEDWKGFYSNKTSFFKPFGFFRTKRFSRLLKDRLLGSSFKPLSTFSSYYFVQGYLNFYTYESLRFVRGIQNSFFYSPIRNYGMIYRYKKVQLEPNYYWSFRRIGFSSFSIRKWVGRSGDGLEPFISPSNCFYFNNSSYFSIPFNNKQILFEPYDNYRSVSELASAARENFLVDLSPFRYDIRWSFLINLAKYSPDIFLYIRNFIYNPSNSDFFRDIYHSEIYSKNTLSFFNFIELTNNFSLFLIYKFRFPTFSYNYPPFQNSFSKFIKCASSFIASNKRFLRSFKSRSGFIRPLKFKRNRFKKVLTIKKSRFFKFNGAPKPLNLKRNLDFLSLWSLFKSKFSTFPTYSSYVNRVYIKAFLKDPFYLYSNSSLGRSFRFRRFFWRNCFENPIRLVLITPPYFSLSSSLVYLSKYLYSHLSSWITSNFSFGSAFILYIFSNITVFPNYFLHSSLPFSDTLFFWSRIWLDPFCISSWKIFLSSVFRSNGSFLGFITKYASLNVFNSSYFLLSRSLVSPTHTFDFLLRLKNILLLSFPNRLIRGLAHKSAFFKKGLFSRSDWKLFSTTLFSIVYSLFSFTLSGSFSSNNISSKFFLLVKNYADTTADFSFILRYLFPSFNPWFVEYSFDTNRDQPEDETLSDVNERLNVDWWQTLPADSSSEHISNLFYSFLSSSSLLKTQVDSSVSIFSQDFLNFLNSPWTLKDRYVFFVENNLPFKFFTKLFSNSVSRISFIQDSSNRDFLLPFFRNEYYFYNSGMLVPYFDTLPKISIPVYYNLETPDEEEEYEFEDSYTEFFEFEDNYLDTDIDDEEETFEIEEEGTEEEQMLDPDRTVSESHPNIEDFDDVLSNEFPLKVPSIFWPALVGELQLSSFHERIGFFGPAQAISFIYPGTLIKRSSVSFVVFSFYCFFKNFSILFSDSEFFEDYFYSEMHR